MIQIIKDSVDRIAWKELSSKAELTNYFQTVNCYDFFSSLSFLDTFVYGVLENEKLVGVVVGYIQKDGGKIKQFLSRRAIITGGPLLADNISSEALRQLLNYTKKQLSGKAIFIETRNFNDYSKYKDVFVKSGFDYIKHLNFHLDCTELDAMKKRMSSSKLRQVKKAIKSGAEIVIASSEVEVKSYYEILDNLYKTRVKTPLLPYEFFHKFFTQKRGKYLLIKKDDKVIGGIMCPIIEGKVIYEFFVAGMDGEYKDCYPSILSTWAAMEYGNSNGIPRFDFMGAGKPDEDYGVRDFKSKFGGELVEYGRFLCVLNPLLYCVGKLGVKFLKRK